MANTLQSGHGLIQKVTTYSKLDKYVVAWGKGQIRRLAVVGPPGTSKTYSYEALGIPMHRFIGRSSALSIFEGLRDDPHMPVVFDDIGQLLRDRGCVDLLKQVGDQRQRREIRWNTKAIKDADLRSFDYSGDVLIVANDLPTQNPDLEAILTRFTTIRFEPTKEELLSKLRSYAPKEDHHIVDFFAMLPIFPSLRLYNSFKDWQRADGIDPFEETMSLVGCDEQLIKCVQIWEEKGKGKLRSSIQRLQELTGLSFHAANKCWTRKGPLAKQIYDARKRSAKSLS